jgi:hypothetical protein
MAPLFVNLPKNWMILNNCDEVENGDSDDTAANGSLMKVE